jgi:hypothetical protein
MTLDVVDNFLFFFEPGFSFLILVVFVVFWALRFRIFGSITLPSPVNDDSSSHSA